MISTLPRWRPSRRGVFAATVAAVIGVLVLVLYLAALLENLERESIDQRFSLRGSQPPGSDIVIVGIDQKPMEELGVRPPLPRPDYAQVLDQVGAGSPRLIVVDVEFGGGPKAIPPGTMNCWPRSPATDRWCWPLAKGSEGSDDGAGRRARRAGSRTSPATAVEAGPRWSCCAECSTRRSTSKHQFPFAAPRCSAISRWTKK